MYDSFHFTAYLKLVILILKRIYFITIGLLFGIVMTKSEVISWYRIQEMFRFDSFHMYGVIMVAFVLGALIQFSVKRFNLKDLFGREIKISDKPKTYKASVLGGVLFGLGWALTGACPGPLYTLLGHGYLSVGLILLSAVLGALVYGLIKRHLPH